MWLSAAGHMPQVHKQPGKACRQQHMSLCRLGQAMHVHLNANPEVWQACRQPPLALVLLLRGRIQSHHRPGANRPAQHLRAHSAAAGGLQTGMRLTAWGLHIQAPVAA